MASSPAFAPLSLISQQSLVHYTESAIANLNNNFNIRNQLLERDRSYAREQDFSEKQKKLHLRNLTGQQVAENVTIPIVMPQVESGTAFLSDLFLTGYPIFPTLSKAQLDPAALQLETVIGEQCIRFGWVPELMMVIRDGLKYNIAAMEVEWTDKKIYSLQTDTTNIKAPAKTVETYTSGNYLKRLNMYNVIMDTRVNNPSRMHIEGEFAGYTELLSKIALKKLFLDLGADTTMNATLAFESGAGVASTNSGDAAYYIPEINPAALLRQGQGVDFNWLGWAGLETEQKIKYSSMYEVTRMYARIIPSEHGLRGPAPNTPQVWKFIVVNRRVLIYAQRQTNAHDYLGILFQQPLEDGLAWQTKSFAENVSGLQTTSSALYNSGLESQRRKVYDRIIYDSSRINKQDIDNTSPAARIPVKQSGYNSNIAQAVYQIPYRDDGVAEIFAVSKDLVDMSNIVNGQNRVQQGQFQKGNKTRTEFNETMQNSDARMWMMALNLEYRFFQPLKEIVKLNILQFQPPATLTNRNINAPVDVNPVDIREAALEFRLADGLMPVDKLMNPESFQLILQMAQGNPQFAAEYDVMGAFWKYLQLKGASWLQDYKRTPTQQQSYLTNEQALNGATTTTTGPTGTTAAPVATQPVA